MAKLTSLPAYITKDGQHKNPKLVVENIEKISPTFTAKPKGKYRKSDLDNMHADTEMLMQRRQLQQDRGFLAAPDKYSQRYNYETYQYDYYCGSQVKIFFGDIWVDDVITIQYNVQQGKQPIYSYAAQNFDAVAMGTVLGEGMLVIAFKEVGYFNVIRAFMEEQKSGVERAKNNINSRLNSGSSDAMTTTNITDTLNIQGSFNPGLIRQSETIEQVLDKLRGYPVEQTVDGSLVNNNNVDFNTSKGYGTKDFEDAAEILEDIIWGDNNGNVLSDKNLQKQHGLLRIDEFDYKWSPTGEAIGVKSALLNNYEDVFNILITYGDITDKRAEHTLTMLNDVHFTSTSVVISPTGEPIAEAYNFFFRDINKSVSDSIIDVNSVAFKLSNDEIFHLSTMKDVEQLISSRQTIYPKIILKSYNDGTKWNPLDITIDKTILEDLGFTPISNKSTKEHNTIVNDYVERVINEYFLANSNPIFSKIQKLAIVFNAVETTTNNGGGTPVYKPHHAGSKPVSIPIQQQASNERNIGSLNMIADKVGDFGYLFRITSPIKNQSQILDVIRREDFFTPLPPKASETESTPQDSKITTQTTNTSQQVNTKDGKVISLDTKAKINSSDGTSIKREASMSDLNTRVESKVNDYNKLVDISNKDANRLIEDERKVDAELAAVDAEILDLNKELEKLKPSTIKQEIKTNDTVQTTKTDTVNNNIVSTETIKNESTTENKVSDILQRYEQLGKPLVNKSLINNTIFDVSQLDLSKRQLRKIEDALKTSSTDVVLDIVKENLQEYNEDLRKSDEREIRKKFDISRKDAQTIISDINILNNLNNTGDLSVFDRDAYLRSYTDTNIKTFIKSKVELGSKATKVSIISQDSINKTVENTDASKNTSKSGGLITSLVQGTTQPILETVIDSSIGVIENATNGVLDTASTFAAGASKVVGDAMSEVVNIGLDALNIEMKKIVHSQEFKNAIRSTAEDVITEYIPKELEFIVDPVVSAGFDIAESLGKLNIEYEKQIKNGKTDKDAITYVTLNAFSILDIKTTDIVKGASEVIVDLAKGAGEQIKTSITNNPIVQGVNELINNQQQENKPFKTPKNTGGGLLNVTGLTALSAIDVDVILSDVSTNNTSTDAVNYKAELDDLFGDNLSMTKTTSSTELKPKTYSLSDLRNEELDANADSELVEYQKYIDSLTARQEVVVSKLTPYTGNFEFKYDPEKSDSVRSYNSSYTPQVYDGNKLTLDISNPDEVVKNIMTTESEGGKYLLNYLANDDLTKIGRTDLITKITNLGPTSKIGTVIDVQREITTAWNESSERTSEGNRYTSSAYGPSQGVWSTIEPLVSPGGELYKQGFTKDSPYDQRFHTAVVKHLAITVAGGNYAELHKQFTSVTPTRFNIIGWD